MPLQDALTSLKQIDIFLKNINEGAGDCYRRTNTRTFTAKTILQQKILDTRL
jgi:hypothetical protein